MESFCVIGKEGSTEDGEGFVQQLWREANSHFAEVAPLAKKDKQGQIAGIWGLMTDFSRRFLPWQDNFSKGLYLAGVEVENDAQPPQGWVKWTVPAYEYLYCRSDGPDAFSRGIAYLEQQGLSLAGAAFEYNKRKLQYCAEAYQLPVPCRASEDGNTVLCK